MTPYRHPDPAIDAWLADGPTTLSASATLAIKSAARALPQRRVVNIPRPGPARRPLLIAAAAVLAAAAALAVIGGPLWFTPVPEPSSSIAFPSAESSLRADVPDLGCLPREEQVPPHPLVGRAASPFAALAIDYAVPATTPLSITMSPGLLHLWAGNAHGLLVVDVTGATRHGSLVEQPQLGTDAASFLAELEKRFPYQGTVVDFDVLQLTATTLAERSGWSARVVMNAEHLWVTHIDRIASNGTRLDRTCAVEFDVNHRLIVLDVGSLIVAVQIWAASEQELARWLPEAMGIADSLRFHEE